MITCDVKEGLHLKSSMTMFDQNKIIVGTSESSQFIKRQIEQKSKFINDYKFIDVDDVNAEVEVDDVKYGIFFLSNAMSC